MKNRTVILALVALAVVFAGCQRPTDIRTDPVVTPPPRAMPAQDTPPQPDRENPYVETSVKPDFRPAVPDEDKASLIYQAELDLLRILICADEQMVVDGGVSDTSEMTQVVAEHFTDMGFRVLDGSPCPAYESSPAELANIANRRDVDMFVLLKASAKQVDKFGDFYSYEADGTGKVAQIEGSELLTTKSAFVRGKRALNAEQAAASALKECGTELALKLTDEIVRKSDRGVLLRRVSVDGLNKTEYVDYIRVGLAAKPGITSVSLVNWDKSTGRAVFWVRLDASVKENLPAYLEEISSVKLKVTDLQKTGAESDKSNWPF